MALFTCILIRAVHFEVVEDMSAEKFLLALRRFIARRGKPDEIVLDNASQFKVTKMVMDKTWTEVVKDPDVYSYVSSSGIKWSFITEFAPWEGGFYERLVACLSKSIGRLLLSKDQLDTFLSETEAVINSRPLVYVDGDINSNNAITPVHFLNIRTSTGTPELSDQHDRKFKGQSTAKQLFDLWKKGQNHLDAAWKIWKDDYLLSLRERYQKYVKSPRVKATSFPTKNQVVHVKDKLPRGAWKMGRITELITGRDGEVRAAKVLLPSGCTVNRPLNCLYPLEVVASGDEFKDDTKGGKNDVVDDEANLEMKPDKNDFNLNRTKNIYEFKNLDNKDTINNNSENTVTGHLPD